MVTLFRSLGILFVVSGLLVMVAAELVIRKSMGEWVRGLLVAGAVCLAVSVVLSVVDRITAKMAGRRCPRCGRSVQHGHIYCADHLKQAVNQFRDSQRQKGERS